MQAVDYQVWPDDPAGHYFRITCRVDEPLAGGQLFRMPAWTPGSYTLRDHARFVTDVEAFSDGRALDVVRDGLSGWRCAPSEQSVEFTYRVFANDESVRTASLDQWGGFYDASGVLVEAVGLDRLPCRITIHRPDPATVHGDWEIAISLPAATAADMVTADQPGQPDQPNQAEQTPSNAVFGSYLAKNYRDLIDHPVQLGAMTWLSFEAHGLPHRVAILGEWTVDEVQLTKDLAAICQWQIDYFDGQAPFADYLFLLRVHDRGYGGLEHRNCSALLYSRAAFADPGKGYRQLLELCSHEYFHAWNVKKIQPQAVAESDLQHPVVFRDLWVFEGVTSYLDGFALAASGCISIQQYLDLVAEQATRLARTTGRGRQTVTESSQACWIGLYKPHEHSPNLGVSYYNKGALIALLVDLQLRSASDHQIQLRDVMRVASDRFADRPIADGALESLIIEMAGTLLDANQCNDLKRVLETLLRTVEELPLRETLEAFGVDVRIAADVAELGEAVPPANASTLGMRLDTEHEFAVVRGLVEGGPAQRAGISVGDQLLAIDGLKLEGASAGRFISRLPKSAVRIELFRRGQLQNFSVMPAEAPSNRWTLGLRSKPTDAERDRRDAWLGVAPSVEDVAQ